MISWAHPAYREHTFPFIAFSFVSQQFISLFQASLRSIFPFIFPWHGPGHIHPVRLVHRFVHHEFCVCDIVAVRRLLDGEKYNGPSTGRPAMVELCWRRWCIALGLRIQRGELCVPSDEWWRQKQFINSSKLLLGVGCCWTVMVFWCMQLGYSVVCVALFYLFSVAHFIVAGSCQRTRTTNILVGFDCCTNNMGTLVHSRIVGIQFQMAGEWWMWWHSRFSRFQKN